ncbi:MAG: hypothetical protein ACPGLV_17615, partial [Bacteroidia bacterium]
YIAYILNLTSWQKVETTLYGKGSRRKKEKRAKDILAYLDTKAVNNEINFVYKRTFGKGEEEKAVFKIIENEE